MDILKAETGSATGKIYNINEIDENHLRVALVGVLLLKPPSNNS